MSTVDELPELLALYRDGQVAKELRHARFTGDELFDKDLDQILVRVESSVFESDEATVAILGHEMHELNGLHKLFEEAGGSMTYQRLHHLISPGFKGNLHDRAWDVADRLVLNMRAGAPK